MKEEEEAGSVGVMSRCLGKRRRVSCSKMEDGSKVETMQECLGGKDGRRD